MRHRPPLLLMLRLVYRPAAMNANPCLPFHGPRPAALFDAWIVVDWSAAGKPTPKRPSANAIWLGSAGRGAEPPRYFRTRAEAMAHLGARLAALVAEGARTLVGFDFPFGYPAGFAAAVTGAPCARALWAALAEGLTDGPDNANNRFDLAARLNAGFPGEGPFWGNGMKADVPGLPRLKPPVVGLAEKRLVETAPFARGAKSCWQLSGAGSVGGQVLTGLFWLERLRADPALAGQIAVWPFETGLEVPIAPVVLAEVYPSMLRARIRARQRPGEVLDCAQVRVLAEEFAARDAAGTMAPLFEGPPALDAEQRARVVAEEGWILGLGDLV